MFNLKIKFNNITIWWGKIFIFILKYLFLAGNNQNDLNIKLFKCVEFMDFLKVQVF